MERTIYPIGIQTFSEIRTKGMKYVDKTDYVYNVARDYKYVFLNRPRRFGKSLLASTLKSYFEADRELFRGLAIDSLETEWTHHPVLYFDMSTAKHATEQRLLNVLDMLLEQYEKQYGITPKVSDANIRLMQLITTAHAQTGQQAVVIIDEYDAPLLDVVHEAENLEKLRQTMSRFYTPLKAYDQYLSFVLLTGSTAFPADAFTSSLNLMDISMSANYTGICGITKEELLTQFTDEISAMAQANGSTTDEIMEQLTANYGGYRFCKKSEEIIDPCSLMNALANKKCGNYKADSDECAYINKMLQHFHTDITALDGITANSRSFYICIEGMYDALPLLYQSGYLTIKDYDPHTQLYTLGIPNQEVGISFDTATRTLGDWKIVEEE